MDDVVIVGAGRQWCCGGLAAGLQGVAGYLFGNRAVGLIRTRPQASGRDWEIARQTTHHPNPQRARRTAGLSR